MYFEIAGPGSGRGDRLARPILVKAELFGGPALQFGPKQKSETQNPKYLDHKWPVVNLVARMLLAAAVLLVIGGLRVFLGAKKQAKGPDGQPFLPQRPVVFDVISLNFGLAVSCQVDMIVLWKISARVPNIPDHGIDEHQSRFEDIEVPFISQDRAQFPEGFDIVEVD